MRIIRLALDEAPAADYARLVAGSAFASPGFLELWGAMRGRPVVHLAQAGGEFVAALPGVEYGTGPAARLASLPDGWYGGVRLEPSIADDRPRITRALYDAVVGWGYAKIAVFDTAARGAEHPALSAEPYETLRADISAPDWAPPDRTLRQEIRKAGREGLRAERFDWARHRAGFLELVAATARRRGERPRYPARLFERLAALAERDDRVIWRYCEREGRPVASQVYVLEGEVLVAWYECFARAFSVLRPHQFIRFGVCREAAARGARWLDLGLTPAGAAGVLAYKRHWGVEPVPLVCQMRWAGLGALARRGKDLAARVSRLTRAR